MPYPKPRALALAEIPGVVADWAAAARRAIAAGFDGVEARRCMGAARAAPQCGGLRLAPSLAHPTAPQVHGANGYLLSEFCSSNTNNRTDAYGGSVENRCRLTLEVVRGVVEAVGADRVGIRLSPYNVFLGVTDAEPPATFGYLIEELSKLNLAYLHLITARQCAAAWRSPVSATLRKNRTISALR